MTPKPKNQREVFGWKTDSNGVPVLSADDIELISGDFLERFDPASLQQPKSVNLGKIVALLRENYSVSFVFDRSLGKDKNGNRYASYYEPHTRTICVDVSLAFKKMQWNFVLAHEIGHFILHSSDKFVDSSFFKLGRIDASIFYKLDSENPLSWLEWQANKLQVAYWYPATL